MLREADWKPTVISIGHRSTLEAFHDRVLELSRAAPVANREAVESMAAEPGVAMIPLARAA